MCTLTNGSLLAAALQRCPCDAWGRLSRSRLESRWAGTASPPPEDEGLQVLELGWATGLFIPGVDDLHRCMFADDSERVSEDGFIQQAEAMRREFFTCDNEVFWTPSTRRPRPRAGP